MPDNRDGTMPEAATHVVVLEPDEPLGRAVATSIWGAAGLNPHIAATATEAVAFIGNNPGTVLSAVINLKAPGVNGLFEQLTQQSMPAIAYGSEDAEERLKDLSSLSISGVILGEREFMPAKLGNAVATLAGNRSIAVLVVDDSRSMRAALKRFLATRCYRVIEATNGKEALAKLASHPGIKLVITDNEMPEMDGFTLVREIRRTHSKEDLAVIGISAQSRSGVSVRFINNGANDFLKKPFVKEELYCRVEHNLDMLARIETIRELSYKDSLTRLYNRRYFFENAGAFMEHAAVLGQQCCVAMLDIDHFKNVNDTYGHDAGDTVLRAVSACIAGHFSENAIVCRFGGEEFCVLSSTEKATDSPEVFEQIRLDIEQLRIKVDGSELSVTVSTGVCCDLHELEGMLKMADGRLYMAKENGRNKVVSTTPRSTVRDR